MTLQPVEPPRPLEWPPLLTKLAATIPETTPLYLVGGTVRDVLTGLVPHDLDFASPDSGLQIARRIANALGGAYFAVDHERRVGRVLLDREGKRATIDVASFRGDDLLADLAGRDFTINALAVSLHEPEWVIDPLGGLQDLLVEKRLRMCSPESIANDPIRALRAVRHARQFRLHFDPATREAARSATGLLTDEAGQLNQPERVRDEVFKHLGSDDPAGNLRVLEGLGLLRAILPGPFSDAPLEAGLRQVESLARLVTNISPRRDDNSAANLLLGVTVMILDRFRKQLYEHLALELVEGRPVASLGLLAALTPTHAARPGKDWAEHFRLANIEEDFLDRLAAARSLLPLQPPVRRREIHRYFRTTGEAGISGVLLTLAGYLTGDPSPDPAEWGRLLDEVASPYLEAFFRRHQQVVSPPPLLTGDDLIENLGLTPGPALGEILRLLLEAQAGDEIRTRNEALKLAEHLADGMSG